MAVGKRRTHEEFISIVKGRYGEEYTILSKYISKRKKVRVLHNECGKEYETAAENLIREGRGGKCPYCKAAWNKRSHEEYKEKFNRIAKNEYFLLSEYKNANEKVRIKHIACGHVWDQSAKNFLLGHGCPICGHAKAMEKQAIKHDEFVCRINDKYNGEYVLLSEYRRMNKPIKVKHDLCGHVFVRTGANLLEGCMCPKCPKVESWGERKITEYLDRTGYRYKRQYKFQDCRYKYPLPFDFAIFYKQDLLCLIEYDGEQHFKPVDAFGGHEEFELTRNRDNIKNE